MESVEGGCIKGGQPSVAKGRNTRFYKTKVRREKYVLIHKEGWQGKRRGRKIRMFVGSRSEVIS
jgi:hypothetical protein